MREAAIVFDLADPGVQLLEIRPIKNVVNRPMAVTGPWRRDPESGSDRLFRAIRTNDPQRALVRTLAGSASPYGALAGRALRGEYVPMRSLVAPRLHNRLAVPCVDAGCGDNEIG